MRSLFLKVRMERYKTAPLERLQIKSKLDQTHCLFSTIKPEART